MRAREQWGKPGAFRPKASNGYIYLYPQPGGVKYVNSARGALFTFKPARAPARQGLNSNSPEGAARGAIICFTPPGEGIRIISPRGQFREYFVKIQFPLYLF